ncbi:MAG: hypothetical protein IPJ61_01790 [Tessaracoccus sp.]|uniref:hypothetical protein n=1 Tax=Tessaracoccus sp. TaxID=1971211 RepID=UPI001EC92DC4|nr:hypothetical protein [Tessaracoccus sp.]MBK7819823.1 hypothetical protein [Tessaracoccus sp.]
MLAGILIAIVVVAGLAFALPWVASQRTPDDELEGDPTERFSNSMRILRHDVLEYGSDQEKAKVSTPLTRRADLTELRLIARQAANRRLVVMGTLLAAGVTLVVLSVLGITPWWSVAIPGGLLVAFVAVARFSVVAMHRSLDARAAALQGGFDDAEDTTVITLTDGEATESVEISVDLAMPPTIGALWDPIPVTPSTYVSQPLLPRTVRTIDLSAPVVASSLVVPTADHPSTEAEETGEIAGVRPEQSNVRSFRRAVGE